MDFQSRDRFKLKEGGERTKPGKRYKVQKKKTRAMKEDQKENYESKGGENKL